VVFRMKKHLSNGSPSNSFSIDASSSQSSHCTHSGHSMSSSASLDRKTNMLSEWVLASKWHEEYKTSNKRDQDRELSLDEIVGAASIHVTDMICTDIPGNGFDLGQRLLKSVAKGRIRKPYHDLSMYWKRHRKNREDLVKILDKLLFRLTFSNFETAQAWYLLEFAKYFVVTLSQAEIEAHFRPVLGKSLPTYEQRWGEINPKLAARLNDFGSLLTPDSDSWRVKRYNYFGRSVNSALPDGVKFTEAVLLILAEFTLEEESIMITFE